MLPYARVCVYECVWCVRIRVYMCGCAWTWVCSVCERICACTVHVFTMDVSTYVRTTYVCAGPDGVHCVHTSVTVCRGCTRVVFVRTCVVVYMCVPSKCSRVYMCGRR